MRNFWPVMVGVLVVVGTINHFAHERELADVRHALDTLASNEIVRRAADSLQWETVIAAETQDLLSLLQSRAESVEDMSARIIGLLEVVESLEGRVATATAINVNLAAALRTDSAAATVFAADPTSPPDSITAPYDDGLLSGTIAFFPPDTTFGLDYSAAIRGSIVTAELPDGRWSVFAAAEDSARVSLEFGEVFVQPAPPIRFCPLPVKAKWAGIGAAALALWRAF